MFTILLIEDNEYLRTNTAEILALANYNVLMAENGCIGIQLASEHQPDLIICDLMMPVMDGYRVLDLVQQDPAMVSIPFIFMTSVEDAGEGERLAGYITKPFNVATLLLLVEAVITRNTNLN